MTTIQFQGQQGVIDCAIEQPDGDIQGWALVLHPHPLYDGTRDNKVVTTMARACLAAGLMVIRPNFRGVGRSAGQFDHSVGESQDMQSLCEQVYQQFPDLIGKRFVLAGFSFGTAVAARLYNKVSSSVDSLVLAGPAVWRFCNEPLELPEHTLIVHGEQDEVVPLQEVFDWIRPYRLPVVILPQASHFFHGHLVTLKRLVGQYLTRC